LIGCRLSAIDFREFDTRSPNPENRSPSFGFHAFTSFLNESLNSVAYSPYMTAIPHAAEALTSALDRFGHASSRVLGAVTGVSDADLGSALVDMSAAKAQAQAGVAVIRFSDEMWRALVEIVQEPSRD
jgi:hypothetical protein